MTLKVTQGHRKRCYLIGHISRLVNALVLSAINLHTTFEGPRFTRSKNVTDPKVYKLVHVTMTIPTWGGLSSQLGYYLLLPTYVLNFRTLPKVWRTTRLSVHLLWKLRVYLVLFPIYSELFVVSRIFSYLTCICLPIWGHCIGISSVSWRQKNSSPYTRSCSVVCMMKTNLTVLLEQRLVTDRDRQVDRPTEIWADRHTEP